MSGRSLMLASPLLSDPVVTVHGRPLRACTRPAACRPYGSGQTTDATNWFVRLLLASAFSAGRLNESAGVNPKSSTLRIWRDSVYDALTRGPRPRRRSTDIKRAFDQLRPVVSYCTMRR